MHYSWKEIDPRLLYSNLYTCEPGFISGPHIIQDHKFIYVERGKGIARIQSRKYEAKAGDLFYYGPDIVHEFRSDTREYLVIYGMHFSLIQPDKVENMFSSDIREASFTAIELRKNQLRLGDFPAGQFQFPEYCHPGSWIQHYFSQLLDQSRKKDDFSIFQSRTLLMGLLTDLSAWSWQQSSLLSSQAGIAHRIKTLLEQHADHLYSRLWLKEWTSYHENHAARLFRQQTGISPHEYHIQQKIIRAQQILQETQMSISDVAVKLNFSNVHYFSKLFKKVAGVSPSEYRNLRKLI